MIAAGSIAVAAPIAAGPEGMAVDRTVTVTGSDGLQVMAMLDRNACAGSCQACGGAETLVAMPVAIVMPGPNGPAPRAAIPLPPPKEKASALKEMGWKPGDVIHFTKMTSTDNWTFPTKVAALMDFVRELRAAHRAQMAGEKEGGVLIVVKRKF